MTDSKHKATYAKRFEAVLAYIDSHLEGDLSVNALSRVAHFSAFHFHRQFETSQKSARGIHIADLAQYLDQQREAALKECAQLNKTFRAG